jgi:DNA-binding SARP family transcriptional activator
MMIPSLQLKLFGSPQISYQGQPLTGFVSAKVRALLIYLAVTGRPHSRDHLAELLWADTPASTRTNLRKALSNLRQLIGDLLVEDAKESIALNGEQVWVDVVEFGRLSQQSSAQEASALYQADFLTGFNLSLSYEFEAWALSEQSRLKSQIVEIVRSLATQYTSTSLSAGSTRNTFSQAISTVRRLLDLEPWHEENHRWLMELLVKDGQRSAALAHFEVCKRVLWDELAVEPSAETVGLVEKIQRAEAQPVKVLPQTRQLLTPEFPLIGRATEWQIIQNAWHRTVKRRVHFVAIAGEAGIGKTRLTEEARLWVAQQGYNSAYARSYAAEGALAYSPVVDWLRNAAIKPTLSQLAPVWLNEVVRLLPELLAEYPHLSPPKPISDGSQRRLFFEALAHAICVTGQPLLLVIDDLQWCDRETLEWLRFLLRFVPDYPLLVIGAYRVEEVTREHFLSKVLLELQRDEFVTEVELGMLSSGETTQLIQAAAATQVSPAQIGAWWKTTLGHPLFVIESVRNNGEATPAHATPRKVQTVIQSRLATLSREARQMAALAATIGHAFSLPLLAAASQLDNEKCLLLLDELWTRRLIQVREKGEYDFTHDRIREVAYAEIPPFQRQILHQRLAQTLETLFQPNLGPLIGELGAHYEQAGLLEPALHCYKQATLNARQLFAHNDLVFYFKKAIATLRQLPSRAELVSEEIDLLVDLGLAYIFTQGWGAKPVGETWHEAYDLALKRGTRFQQCRALLGLDIYFNNLGEMHTARIYSQKSYELAQEEADVFLRQQTLGNYGGILYHLGEPDQSLPYFEQMLAIHQPGLAPSFIWLHRDASTNALVRSAKSLWFLGYADQARSRCEKAIAIARHDFDLFTLTAALDFSSMVYSFCQDYLSVQRLSEELIAVATKYEFPYYWMLGKIYVAWAAVQQGDRSATAKMAEHISEFFAVNRTRKFAPQRNAMWAEVLLKEGQAAVAMTVIDEVLQSVEQSGNIYFNAHLLKVKGDCLLALQQEEAVIETVYHQSLAFARKQAAKSFELRSSLALARLWQAQGRQCEAYQLLAPIYGWFTEGFDTPDLIEARQLLDTLTALQPMPS